MAEPGRRRALIVAGVFGALLALWLLRPPPLSQAEAHAASDGGCLAPAPRPPAPAAAPQPLPEVTPADADVLVPSEGDAPPQRPPTPPGPSQLPSAPDLDTFTPVAPIVHLVGLPGSQGRLVSIDFLPSGELVVRDANGRVFRGAVASPLQEVTKGRAANGIVATPRGLWLAVDGDLLDPLLGPRRFPGPWVGRYAEAATLPTAASDWPLALRVDDVTASRLVVGTTATDQPLEAVGVVSRDSHHLAWSLRGDELAWVSGGALYLSAPSGPPQRHEARPSLAPIATPGGWAVVEASVLELLDGPPLLDAVQIPVSGHLGHTWQGDWIAARHHGQHIALVPTDGGVPIALQLSTTDIQALAVHADPPTGLIVAFLASSASSDVLGWVQVPTTLDATTPPTEP